MRYAPDQITIGLNVSLEGAQKGNIVFTFNIPRDEIDLIDAGGVKFIYDECRPLEAMIFSMISKEEIYKRACEEAAMCASEGA